MSLDCGLKNVLMGFILSFLERVEGRQGYLFLGNRNGRKIIVEPDSQWICGAQTALCADFFPWSLFFSPRSCWASVFTMVRF